MPREAELHDGTILEFPDNTTDEVMRQAVKKYLANTIPATGKAEYISALPEGTFDKLRQGDIDQARGVKEFAKNVVKSGANMIGGIGTAISHPLNTLEGIGGTLIGTAELVPGVTKLLDAFGMPTSKPYVDALANHYKQKYGSWDGLKKALYEDPVGVAGDVSIVAGGTGAVARGTGILAKTAGMTKVAGMAGKVGEIAGAVSSATDPVQLAAKAAKMVIPAGAATRLYESALKPSLGKQNLPRIASELQTGLKENIPISQGGIDKIGDLVDDLQSKISDTISANNSAGKTINPQAVAGRLADTEKTFAAQVNPNADLRAIARSKREFLNKYAIKDKAGNITGYKDIPVEDAQALKTGTYKQLKSKSYGELKGAEIEAQKALARGIKEELVTAIPELAELNARESKLLQLQPILEKAVARIRNHQLFGIGTPLAAAGAEAVTGNPKIALAVAAVRATLEQPQIKSRLAYSIYNMQQRNPVKYGLPSMATANARLQNYLDSLSEQTNRQQTQSATPTQ
jgi:hypothetical protein